MEYALFHALLKGISCSPQAHVGSSCFVGERLLRVQGCDLEQFVESQLSKAQVGIMAAAMAAMHLKYGIRVKAKKGGERGRDDMGLIRTLLSKHFPRRFLPYKYIDVNTRMQGVLKYATTGTVEQIATGLRIVDPQAPTLDFRRKETYPDACGRLAKRVQPFLQEEDVRYAVHALFEQAVTELDRIRPQKRSYPLTSWSHSIGFAYKRDAHETKKVVGKALEDQMPTYKGKIKGTFPCVPGTL